MGRFRSAIYARLEEMSFRSGAALAVGVLAAIGVAVLLVVTLTGHSAARTGAAATGASGSGPARAPSPSAARPAPRPATPAASLAPVAAYQSPTPVYVPVTSRRAAPSTSPPSSSPVPRPTWTVSPEPTNIGSPFFPGYPNPGGLAAGEPDVAAGLSWRGEARPPVGQRGRRV